MKYSPAHIATIDGRRRAASESPSKAQDIFGSA